MSQYQADGNDENEARRVLLHYTKGTYCPWSIPSDWKVKEKDINISTRYDTEPIFCTSVSRCSFVKASITRIMEASLCGCKYYAAKPEYMSHSEFYKQAFWRCDAVL